MTWKSYPAYKPSGVEWLGDVPEHWEVKRLKYSASINDDALPETTDPDFEFDYVDIGSVSAVYGITTREQMIFDTAPSRARRRVKAGDTIVSTVRTYLRAIAPITESAKTTIVSTGFAVVRPRKVEPKYLTYALRESSFVENVVARSTGVSYPAVNASEVGCIPIPLPQPAEQRAIADFLDRETGRIDRLVAKKRVLIEKLKEKRVALISRTVTRGLNPAAKLKASGVDGSTSLTAGWLGDVPEHWKVKRIRHLALLRSGESITSTEIDAEGEYPVYGGNGLRGYTTTYSHDGHYVLIGRQGALCGNINYASGKFWASEHAVVVRPLVPFEPFWMGELLRTMNLNQYSVSAAQPGLSVDVISALKIPVPPLPEQRAIADFLARETGKIDRLVAKVEEAIERLQEYRTALITAAVTGKIDVREAAA